MKLRVEYTQERTVYSRGFVTVHLPDDTPADALPQAALDKVSREEWEPGDCAEADESIEYAGGPRLLSITDSDENELMTTDIYPE